MLNEHRHKHTVDLKHAVCCARERPAQRKRVCEQRRVLWLRQFCPPESANSAARVVDKQLTQTKEQAG